MSWDPFDEFERIRKRMRKLGGGGLSGGYSVSVQDINGKVRVDVQGNLPPEELEQLKRQYPKADIFVNGEKVSGKPGIVPIEEEETPPKKSNC
jgi:hypothetical protein